MIWLDDTEDYGDPNNPGSRSTSNMFEETAQVQADYPGETRITGMPASPLAYSDAVDIAAGGGPGTGKLLGFSTGYLNMRQKWQKFTGLMVAPPRTAELRIGSPYGQIGLDNRIQNLLLGTEYQETPSLLPTTAQIAASYVRPKNA